MHTTKCIDLIAKSWTIELPSGETELALWEQVLASNGGLEEAYPLEFYE